jgi:uncharacterized membrane protein YphA (DoxX/SURF4 family)
MVAGEVTADNKAGSALRAVMTQQRWITLVVRVALAGILGYAGYAKFSEAQPLQKLAVSSYEIVPKGMVDTVAFGLPILEMVLAAMLLLGFATRAMAICVSVLFVIFIAGILSSWARGLSIDCGCFGGGGQTTKPGYLGEIFRDLGFLVLAAWVVAFPKAKLSLDRLLGLYSD